MSLIKSQYDAHQERVRSLKHRDLNLISWGGTGAHSLLHMITNEDFVPSNDNIYRVKVDKHSAEVLCLGLDSVDVEDTGKYSSVDRLPEWIQHKLAVLLMLDTTPPDCALDKIGIRIDRNTFWVFKDS